MAPNLNYDKDADVPVVTTEVANDDKETDFDEETPTKEVDLRTKPFIFIVCTAAALGGLIFGYDIGGAGGTFVMDGFRQHFEWDCPADASDCTPASSGHISTDQGLINGLFGAGAAIGAALAPKVFEDFGRKKCLYAASIVFILGASLQAAAWTMTVMQVARIFSGMGIGGLSMCSPVYIAELAPEHRRGELATLWQLAIVTGIVLVSILNIWLKTWDDGWRISYGGNVVFALLLIGMLSIMPESPRWLVAKGRDVEAREAMQTIRFDDQVDDEMNLLALEALAEKERGDATWSEIFVTDNKMRYRVLMGMGLQMIQQLSGINAIMFYAPTIIERFFGSDGGINGGLALNVVNFFATFITIATVEKFGRVFLLCSGAVLMCLALVTNAVLSNDAITQTDAVGYCVVIFSALYVIGFAYSWGPIVWVVCAEMFPLRERGKATGLTTFSNWFWTTVVGAVFPHASDASLSGCFAFFGGVVFVAFFVVYFLLPETANRSIVAIDEEFKNHKPEHPRKKWV